MYIVWNDDIDSLSTFDAFLVGSSDSGDSFTLSYNISDNTDTSLHPHIAATGTGVYVVWDDDTGDPGTPDAFFANSSDNGVSFSAPINLSDAAGIISEPRVAASDNMIYVVWKDFTPGDSDVFIGIIEDRGTPTVTIETVSDNSPKWDDTVEVSGTANADITDTITIDWGDGTSDIDIPVTDGEWGPVDHEYDSAHVGENEIVARLLDDSDTERAASDPETIDVQKHETVFTIDMIFSVVKGDDVTVQGTLVDADASAPLDGMTVTFTGTGAVNLADVMTSSGLYSSTGASPSTASALMAVQAHYAGDSSYEASDSEIISYDTVEPDAATFAVPAGTPSGPIMLTGFDSSILFDDVASAGSVFVSSCDSPTSVRYVELGGDVCVQISPVVEMEPDASAHITVSFDGVALPEGYTEEDIGIFRESVSGITEITESRDIEDNTVTGVTAGFSRFIVGVALHDDAPAGASQEQLLVGDNDVTFEFTETREIAFSDNSFSERSTVTLSVTDPYANLDSSDQDTMTASVVSTSDLAGIEVTLEETDVDSGSFTGTFELSSTASSQALSRLQADSGDEIEATYEATTKSPLVMTVSDVSEAGLVQAAGYDAPDFITPVGEGYDLSLLDAELSDSSIMTLTMSYADAELVPGDDPAVFRIVRTEGATCAEVLSTTLDAGEETVSATISVLGQYTIAMAGGPVPLSCPAGPGGSGGGLPRPGSGLVLDAVAVITRRASGGSGSSQLASSTGISSDADVTVSVGGETVSVTFDTAQNEEKLSAEAQELADIADLFSEVDDIQGHGIVNDSQFSTAGTVFEIDASDVDYEGTIEITIPYDESLVKDEDNVRFMHHGKDGWEDGTVEIDAGENTVTGQVTSLSPVVAAVVEDGTYGEIYFNVHPTKRMMVTDDMPENLVLESHSQTVLQATVKNSQRTNQTYAFVIQVLDEVGYTQSITWQTGTLDSGASTVVSSSWSGQDGTYTVRMFVWTNISVPLALSDVYTKTIIAG
ncbi:hypothetical protein [Candidatus Nitrososphaera sp. FF02]|uniref:hypothetical protein n=1 Tax=Candidatus Nitrososphaera sp. FF02 TaxID=3398226 RepID=UPI0039EBA2C2